MSPETSRRTMLKLMAARSLAFREPGVLGQRSVLEPYSPIPPITTQAEAPSLTSETEPDALAMLNKINNFLGEQSEKDAFNAVDDILAIKLSLPNYIVDITNTTYPHDANDIPYQVGSITYYPDDYPSPFIGFCFDSLGQSWVETPLLPCHSPAEIDSETITPYNQALQQWYTDAEKFSPTTVWAGVQEALALRDSPEAPNTFVEDQIHPMINLDGLEEIRDRFFPDVSLPSNQLFPEFFFDPDKEEEKEVADAWEAYERGEYFSWTSSDIEKLLRSITTPKAGFLSRGISRLHLLGAGRALFKEIAAIASGQNYTALPEQITAILNAVDRPLEIDPETQVDPLPLSSTIFNP